MAAPRRWYRKKRLWIPALLIVVLAGYLASEVHEPAEVPLEPVSAWGLTCLRARDLVIQCRDDEGNVWATRGMWAYRRRKGEDRFVREYHVPAGLSRYWLLNLAFVRRVFCRDEVVELLTLPGGAVCAMAGGHMWHRPAEGATFVKTLTLRHYGVGIGRGILPNGLARLKDGTILIGEYFRNDDRTSVRVYASRDNGNTWAVRYEYEPGRIRHIHAVQQDPYSDKAWVCTGDFDPESSIAWSNDACKTLHPIGSGSQVWRAYELAFAPEAVYWGADTGSPSDSGIYRWDRAAREMTKVADVPGAMFFATRLDDGTIYMSTNRESGKNEKDNITRLWVIRDGRLVKSIPCGTRLSMRSFGYLRFERTQGGAELYVTCHNVSDFNGDLLVIPPDN